MDPVYEEIYDSEVKVKFHMKECSAYQGVDNSLIPMDSCPAYITHSEFTQKAWIYNWSTKRLYPIDKWQ